MNRKTEGTSMFGGFTTGLPSQTVVRWFSIGLIIMTGLWCVQLRGATNKISGFETPPPLPGSIQWDKLHRTAEEQQELYRKRVSIPGAVAQDVPRAEGANFANHQKIVTAPAQPPVVASGIFRKILFFAAMFTFIGVLLVKFFAPDALNQWLNPWALAPATERRFSEKVRAEEEAFGKFLATFRVGPAASSHTDLFERDDPIKEFYARAAKFLAAQRKLLQDIGRESRGAARQKIIASLRSEMSSLKGAADLPEALPVWQVASALEGLLQQLTGKMGNVTPSTLRAVAGGVDLLDSLCVPGLKPEVLTDRPLKFLVVDDDLISRQAMSLALKKTFGQPDLAVDGETALAQAGRQAYDVIFLDVQLPGMDGFELCEKIRDSNLNRNTPVVFVTSQSDFDARAKSTLSGGNDLMGKPFLIFEITVKALTLGLQNRLPARVQKPLTRPDQVRDKKNSLESVADSPLPVSSSTIISRPSISTPATAEMDDFTEVFLARASTQLGPLRELCQTILQASDEETRQSMLADGFLRINSLISKNGSEVVHPAYQICAALEGLFKKLLENQKNSTPSTLATVVTAVDLLQDLCAMGLRADLAINPPVQMLVVDDDLVTRRVIVGALQTAFARPESVESGESALALATEKPFDVIFLDVVMPGMNGFEVCSKIRETIPNRATPVVFVTGQSDFQTRTQMSSNGGNDLMGKPFFTSEITVKALTFALRGRLDRLKPQPAFTSMSLLLQSKR
jgi:CheY-like chemotaxis protein